LRLLRWAEPAYDAAVVLIPRANRGAGRVLTSEMRRFIDAVELRVVDLPDPSDHAQLFDAMSDLLPDLPDEARLPESQIDVLLSAGTPQAQTIWVIAVQAGLLDARMLQVIPPQFVPVPHPHPVRVVRLEIDGFPRFGRCAKRSCGCECRAGRAIWWARRRVCGCSPIASRGWRGPTCRC
jgi:two-component system response regulator AtoC